MSSEQQSLAALIQNHVPHQPWGSSGNSPVPVEFWFDNGSWGVKFVLGLNSTGTKRRWGWAKGETLEDALRNARASQRHDARQKQETEQ